MKYSTRRRARRRRRALCLLAAALLLLVFLHKNLLLGISSRSAILLDRQTETVLAQKNAREPCAPASLTKMMTVLLAAEACPDLDVPVTLPEEIFPELEAQGASMAGFAPGETVPLRDLLYGAMLPSGAECCEALARQVSGSEEAFVALMNQKARELGMSHTWFENPTGLTGTNHKSTVEDLAVLLCAALQNQTFYKVFTTAKYTCSPTPQHPDGLQRVSTLLSRLDGDEIPNGTILGGKTGYTSAAGLCLASLAQVDGRQYILITLHAPGSHATEPFHIRDAIKVYRRLAHVWW